MELGITEILAGAVVLFVALYYYLTSNFDFWEKRGVKGPKPVPIFGNLKDAVFGRINFSLLIKEFYDAYKGEQFVGIYGRNSPLLILRDPDLIRDVLISDFNAFPDRGLGGRVQKDDPFNQNLLNLEYKRWHPLRKKLSPVFSSGKLRNMFYLIVECGEHLEAYVGELVGKGEPVECRELMAKYTTDVIGVCAFGLNANSLSEEDGGFRRSGRELMTSNWKNVMRGMCRDWFPRLYHLLRPLIYNRAIDFFIDSIKETMEYRKRNKVRRDDFVDLLMELRENEEDFTDAVLTSQAFIFFLAGFETSSTTTSNALYELALNQSVQNKLRREIKEVLEKDGKLTYENVKSMKYLDMVVKETLRKYPPGGILQRKAATEYTFVGTKLSIPEDTRVIVPVWAIHNDPDIYPSPDAFDPERFNEENESSRHPMNYLPFGDGPHNCIGLRFANYQTKIGIIMIIKNFRVDVCDKTCIPYRVLPRSFIPAPVGGIHLEISKLVEFY